MANANLPQWLQSSGLLPAHLLASPWVNLGIVEHASLLQDCTLVDPIERGVFSCKQGIQSSSITAGIQSK
jgi:hypothetical protein